MIYCYIVLGFFIWFLIVTFSYFTLKEDYTDYFLFEADGVMMFLTLVSIIAELIMTFIILYHFKDYLAYILHHILLVCILTAVLFLLSVLYYQLLQEAGWKQYKKIKLYRMQKNEIRRQLDGIKKYSKEIKCDSDLTDEDRKKLLELLKDSKKALKKSYSDVCLALHMLTIKDTLDSVNVNTDEINVQDELQERLDVIDSLDELSKKYQ